MLEELPDDGAGAADEELLDGDDELGDEELLSLDVEPAPAEPLGEDELELDGVLEDEAPPLAVSFLGVSLELDEELAPEPEPEGVALELEGELVAPEPDGVVALEDEEPDGALEALSDLLQPAINAPPNARETARARVENFMGAPWLGYRDQAARIGPRMLRSHPAAWFFT